MNTEDYKPNLIPNNPKDDSFDRNAKIIQNGGYEKYLTTLKKDGCRLAMADGSVKTRSLKTPGSKLVVERFQPLADLCKKLNIIIDGEFYMHGLKFNAIYRFFSKTDVTCSKYKLKLEKEFQKDEEKYLDKYDGFSVEHLTTFHEGLKFWLFDGIILDRPDLIRYEDRINEIVNRLINAGGFKYLVFPTISQVENEYDLEDFYEDALANGWEGLVLLMKITNINAVEIH